MVSLAERYDAGAHVEVWQELRALGPAVQDPPHLAEARAVAKRTAARVATNISLLVVRLTAMGYRFGARHNHNQRRGALVQLGLRDTMAEAGRDVAWIDAGEVEEHVMGWAPPGGDTLDDVARIEQLTGPLPLLLRALLVQVGAVDLAGSFPAWDPPAYDFTEGLGADRLGFSDPLNLFGAERVAEFVAVDTNLLLAATSTTPRRSSVPIANNRELGANVAGDFHVVLLPEASADPLVRGVHGQDEVRLLDWLRHAFAWGGFPGFADHPEPPAELDVLRRDLLAL